jgi:hypothetical protein
MASVNKYELKFRDKYWIHSNGEVDKIGSSSHWDFVHSNPERFGLPVGHVKKVINNNILKNHFRVGYSFGPPLGILIYIETYYTDNNTLFILKKYMPPEIPREGVRLLWASIELPELWTTADRFFKSISVEQLTQKGVPEYHKTITQFREIIREMLLNTNKRG